MLTNRFSRPRGYGNGSVEFFRTAECARFRWPGLRRLPTAVFWLAVGCLMLLHSGAAFGQVQIQVEQKAAEIAQPVQDRDNPKKVKENEEKYAGGAALKTDSDLEDQLKRAETFVAEKNWRNATILWDRVLEKSGNSLITRDGETYISLVKQVEETIRNLPPNGLQVYRISADGKARALMPGDPGEADDIALEKLVRLYFMSSLGDDAAFELGCRSLDRRDFVSASRLFSKILDEHPDPSIDRNEVLIRQAIAAGNLGDRKAAEQALQAVQTDGNNAAGQLLVNVRKHLEFLESSTPIAGTVGDSIAMRLVDSQRTGVMPELPEEALSGDLTQGYEFRFPLSYKNEGVETDLGAVHKGGGKSQAASPDVTSLSEKWKTEKWFPTNLLLFSEGRIVLKTTNDLVCIDATGRADKSFWHSLWLNNFELDGASWNAKTYGANARNRNGMKLPIPFPLDEKEAWYFYDRIHQSMALHGGVVYTIEGRSYSPLDDTVPKTRRTSTVRSFNQPVNLSRSRTNFLTAYDLRTGKVLWTRSAYEAVAEPEDEEESDTAAKVGFLGTPVPFGNLILCPVTEGGAISLYAMDSANRGKTVWKTFLCDDPSTGVNHFAPVEITIAGQDAYVTCGSGVLFALNAATGNIQFARRYQRDGTKKKVQTSYNQFQEMLLLEGWDDNLVIAWKNALVVMASDHDYVFAIDRRNGRFLWDAPRLPFDEDVDHAYCLGYYNGKMVMATNRGILCYNLAGDGKLQWYQKFGGNSFGRGFLTPTAVYVPVEDSIIKYDLETGRKLAQVGVNLGTEYKVGNLFSDGKQIWVAGLNRVVALRSLRDRLAELDTQVAAGDERAFRERLGIFAKLGEFEKALADARQLFDKGTDKKVAFEQFLQNVKETKVANEGALACLKAIDEIFKQHFEPVTLALKNDLGSVFEIAQAASRQDESAVEKMVLRWSSLEVSPGFDSAIQQFLTRHPPDPALVEPVLAKATTRQLLTLIPVLAKTEQAKRLLASVLANPGEDVRLSAATELALLGDKSCLEAAWKLLSSEDPGRRTQAHLILKNVTGADIEFDPEGKPDERKKAIDQWRKWLDENAENLKVSLPVELKFGRILVATSNRVLEYSLARDGLRRVDELDGFNPEDLMTARNGNRVVAEFRNRQIVELDRSGKVLKRIALKYNPSSVRKLANGNYLVAWRYVTKPVVEIDDQGKVVWEAKVRGYVYSVERLGNGHTLLALGDRVLEIDNDSRVVYSLGRTQGVANCKEAKRLPDGNTMVVFGTQVVVFDSNRNPVLRIRGAFSPKSATRLPDGRILVAHGTGLRVFDKEGTKIGDDLVNENVNAVWFY